MKFVKINSLFHVKYGNKFSKISDYKQGITPVIKSQATNNGVAAFLELKPNYSNILTVARTGSVGATFFHKKPCYVTDDCMVLIPKNIMSDKTMLILATIISKETFKYNYSRKVTPERLAFTRIPTLECLHEDTKNITIPDSPTVKSIISRKKTVAPQNYSYFRCKDIFNISYGNGYSLQSLELQKNGIAFIARGGKNNGISAYVSKTKDKPFQSHCITVSLGGSVLETFYQIEPFYTAYHIKVLIPKKEMSIYTVFYILTLFKLEKYRFNYGRQANKTLSYLTIRLPVTQIGDPDYQFMEDYIKSLPYSSSI